MTGFAARQREIDTSSLMREIAYDPPSRHAERAACLLAWMIPNIRVRSSWLIPGDAELKFAYDRLLAVRCEACRDARKQEVA